MVEARPDPSFLTTEALRREVRGLEAVISQRIDAVLALMQEQDKRINQQFEAIADERRGNFEKLKEDIDTQVNARSELDEVKFTSVHQSFQRLKDEWSVHDQDHERERGVAKDTAQRLEREVESTAQRLERTVEETAYRLETGVQTALAAVGETARVHADAHAKEHIAHERIHGVEKVQVDKAEGAMNKRLEGMNEFRQALNDQNAKAIPREVFEAAVKEVNTKIDFRANANAERITTLERFKDQTQGKTEGLTATGRLVVGVISAIAAVVAIVSVVLAFGAP